MKILVVYDSQLKEEREERAACRGFITAKKRRRRTCRKKSKPFVYCSYIISDRSKPDLSIEDGYDLSAYGFDAKVLSIPGHSKGSIGILTTGGDLFCGDLLINTDKPALNDIIDDSAAANASVERLKSLNIHTVYPGHGKSFPMELFLKTH